MAQQLSPKEQRLNIIVDAIRGLQRATRVINDDTATNIADKDAPINTSEKRAGKLVRDTTNNRLMMARGSGATDNWDVVDASASVTPS